MQSRTPLINRGVASASSGANSWGYRRPTLLVQRELQYRWASRTRCRRRFTSSRSLLLDCQQRIRARLALGTRHHRPIGVELRRHLLEAAHSLLE